MDELRSYLHSLGYDIPNLTLDGKIYRFARGKSKDSGWIIGWVHQYIRKSGSYCIAIFGDWRTAEIHTYIPKGIGGAEKELVKTVIDEAKKKVRAEREVLNKEAAIKAKQRYERASAKLDTAYSIRKKLKSLYGARVEGENIVVPMRNLEGEIVGTQRILPDGQKFFEKGQKTDESFFLIGELVSPLCIAEGFATAVSLHEALGHNVVAAFSANNLVKVSKLIRKEYPDLEMIICGDDDYKNDVNIGVEKANEAGLASMSPVIFPAFTKEPRGTDFNDLASLEGLEAVRALFEENKEPEHGFRSLGYDDHGHYFYRLDAKDVFKLSAFSPQNFFHLAPESFWVANYKAGDGDKTNYTRAANDLISASIKRGRFDSHSLRGLGVWLDDDRVVVNTGDKLYVDNREMPLAWDKGCYIYVHTHHKMRLSKNVATIDECRLLLDACSGLKFTDDKAMHLLAGWLAIARVAGALPVRPHIWLTGGSATGKSTVLTRLIEPALGGQHTFLSCVGGTTEAGIRQTLKSSSLPAVFDEFESVNKATKERHESIIELLRNTWSATNGQIIKGSAGGTSNSFNLAFPALLSSIGVNLLTDADRSRFSVLELMPHGDDPTQFARLCDALNKITPELGNRIFNRMVQMIPALLKNYALLRDAIARQSRQRLGQQIGMLMAGWCCLSYDETITEETARAIAIELEVEKINEDRETEEQACLRHLMTTIIRLDEGQSNESASIEQVIFAKSEDGEGHAKELRKYGILVKDGFIYVSNKHSFLQKVFNATQWPNWSVHLKRLKEASICNTAIYFSAGQVAKSVKIPLITLKHN